MTCHWLRTFVAVFFLPAAAVAFLLDSMLARGDSCLSIQWSPDSINTRSFWYAKCCPGNTEFSRCDFTAGVVYRGVAYSYGGEDHFAIFRTRLAAGALVGSHECHYKNCGDPSDSVTGIDCSAFVCYLWNVPRVSTRDLASSSRYIKVPKNEVQPGDALVKAGSHALMVVECDQYPKVVIWESYGWPINGCRERSIDLSVPYWDQYDCIRNPHLTTITRNTIGSAACPLAHFVRTERPLYSIDGRKIASRPMSSSSFCGIVIFYSTSACTPGNSGRFRCFANSKNP